MSFDSFGRGQRRGWVTRPGCATDIGPTLRKTTHDQTLKQPETGYVPGAKTRQGATPCATCRIGSFVHRIPALDRDESGFHNHEYLSWRVHQPVLIIVKRMRDVLGAMAYRRSDSAAAVPDRQHSSESISSGARCTSADSIASCRCAPRSSLRMSTVSRERERTIRRPGVARYSSAQHRRDVVVGNRHSPDSCHNVSYRGRCSGAWLAGAHRARWIHNRDRPAPMRSVDAGYLGLLTHRRPYGSNDLIESAVSSVSTDSRTCAAVSA